MRQPLTYGVRTEVLVTKPNQMLEEHAVLISVFGLRHGTTASSLLLCYFHIYFYFSEFFLEFDLYSFIQFGSLISYPLSYDLFALICLLIFSVLITYLFCDDDSDRNRTLLLGFPSLNNLTINSVWKSKSIYNVKILLSGLNLTRVGKNTSNPYIVIMFSVPMRVFF